MRAFGKALLGAVLLSSAAAAAENTFVVPDTVGYFERLFGLRGKVSGWVADGTGSTLTVGFPGKGQVSFHLAQASSRVDQAQVEPVAGALSPEQAAAYAAFLADDLSRNANMACRKVRDDRDGINAFLSYACAGKAAPAATSVEVAVTVQSVGGRNIVFVQFNKKQRPD